MTPKPISVLIVDDSPIQQKLFSHLCKMDSSLQVIGVVGDGAEALTFIGNQRPDVILMDIMMPVMNGFEATRRIMETDPIPIIICSASTKPGEVDKTFLALEAGAVAFIAKPAGPGHPQFQSDVANLIQTLKDMAEVKLTKRSRRKPAEGAVEPVWGGARFLSNRPPWLIAIGASTGGPVALQTILKNLPKDYPVPLMIVQHITAGFMRGLADWLESTTGFPVQIASTGMKMAPGHAYLAPDGFHMGINGEGAILLSSALPENGLRPAVSFLFRSVTEVCGSSAVGILLTGMGKDGAEDLKRMKDRGALTIAQDWESSVIHGMPGEAIRLGGAREVLPPEAIAQLLASLVTQP
ncbi:MAG: chemotaxis-specific protein-glutamate methyltransferase CheB [bacterium]